MGTKVGYNTLNGYGINSLSFAFTNSGSINKNQNIIVTSNRASGTSMSVPWSSVSASPQTVKISDYTSNDFKFQTTNTHNSTNSLTLSIK